MFDWDPLTSSVMSPAGGHTLFRVFPAANLIGITRLAAGQHYDAFDVSSHPVPLAERMLAMRIVCHRLASDLIAGRIRAGNNVAERRALGEHPWLVV